MNLAARAGILTEKRFPVATFKGTAGMVLKE